MNNPMDRLIGFCRHCYAPITGAGATCDHHGFLIWTPSEVFWQGDSGEYQYWATMRLDHEPQTTGNMVADAADIIAAILR